MFPGESIIEEDAEVADLVGDRDAKGGVGGTEV